MNAVILHFPKKEFFVESFDYEKPNENTIIKLEAQTWDRAEEEAKAIADYNGWYGWFVYDERMMLKH